MRRGQQPTAVVLLSQEFCKAAVGIETWQTKPVDGPIKPNKGGGLTVANKGVVFDPSHSNTTEQTGFALPSSTPTSFSLEPFG